jgi:hypothetical protein
MGRRKKYLTEEQIKEHKSQDNKDYYQKNKQRILDRMAEKRKVENTTNESTN